LTGQNHQPRIIRQPLMRPKYEREIEEILSRLDDSPPRRVQSPVLEPLPRIVRPPRQVARPTASGLMVTALVLSVVSSPMQWVYPPAVVAVGIVSVVLLLVGLGMSVLRWGASRPSRVWRGRPVETAPGLLAGLARRWRRWKAHRRFRDPRWN
jgi:hypothetical protein